MLVSDQDDVCFREGGIVGIFGDGIDLYDMAAVFDHQACMFDECDGQLAAVARFQLINCKVTCRKGGVCKQTAHKNK